MVTYEQIQAVKHDSFKRTELALVILVDVLMYILNDGIRKAKSLQGYERNTDPNLTRIAGEGVMFENSYRASSSGPPP